MNGKVSIIVPVYNVENYLDKCIESIVNQTYENLEIILVDDGSPDNCPATCDSWAQKDSRVKVIHKENGGVSSARNAALDIASGDYIGFVDSDDWIEPDMYEILIKNAEEYDAEISRCAGFFDYDDRSEEYSETVSCTVCNGRDELVKSVISDDTYANLWMGIYKKSLFNSVRFDSDIAVGEDWLVNYWLNKAANRKVVVKEHKYHYVQRQSSALHSDSAKKYIDVIKVVNIFWNNEFSNGFKAELSGVYSKFIIDYFNCVIESNTKDDKTKAMRDDLRSKFKKLCGISNLRKMRLFVIAYFPHLYAAIYKVMRRK